MLKTTSVVFIAVYCVNIATCSNNSICSCYRLGAVSNIQSSLKDDNKLLQCERHPDTAKKCYSKCEDGYYNILSGRRCFDCNCNFLKCCNALPGQSKCQKRYTGLQCNRCKTYICKSGSQNCTSDGTTNIHCNTNTTGNVPGGCKENIQEPSCLPYPACYELVQNAAANYTEELKAVEATVDKIKNNYTSYLQDYQSFLDNVKLLSSKIQELKAKFENANKTVLLEQPVTDLTSKVSNFYNLTNKLVKLIQDDFNYPEIENALRVGHTNLKEANELVQTCERALNKLTETSLNHNNVMSATAREALEKVQGIGDKAQQAYELSLNISTECNVSCDSSRQLTDRQNNVKEKLEQIGIQILKKLNQTNEMMQHLDEFRENIEAMKNKALLHLETLGNLTVPSVDNLINDLNTIDEEYAMINQKMDELAALSSKFKDAEWLSILEDTSNKYKAIDDAFLLAQMYKNQAEAEIKSSEGALKIAQAVFIKATDMEKMKQSIEELLADIPKIKQEVDAVLNNTNDTKNIFDELLEMVNEINAMKSNVTKLLLSNEKNKEANMQNLVKIEELERTVIKMNEKLKAHEGRLSEIKNTLKYIQERHTDVERNINKLKEYILILKILPTENEELDEVEADVKIMENMIGTIDYLVGLKNKLKSEMDRMKSILESIPIDDASLCESAKNEVKISRS